MEDYLNKYQFKVCDYEGITYIIYQDEDVEVTLGLEHFLETMNTNFFYNRPV